MQRKIIHIDMDCFYAAVEVLDNPELKGKPVIVGGREKRGVVSAANYEARAYGVRSAMPVSQALALCKTAINVPVRMQRYKEISVKIHEIFSRYTDLIQPISLDEAFLDVTQNKKNMEYATPIAKEIKQSILNELGLIASAGVAPNRFLAKIASDMDKPDGLFVIRPHQVDGFMKELPVKKIWGVGKVMGKTLDDLGIHMAADVQRFPKEFLEKKFGKMGRHLYQLSQGIDHSQVKVERQQKSVGKETTFTEDIYDKVALSLELKKLSERCEVRLKSKGLIAHGVTLKLKFDNFQLITRSQLVEEGCVESVDIAKVADLLLNELDLEGRGVRLIGVSTYKLSAGSEETNLFDWMPE